MSKNCVQDLCVKCNTHILEGRFYPALKAIDLIEKKYLHNIPIKTMKILIEKRMLLIKMHIEKRVYSEVNKWLVHIRSAAKDIGHTAIVYAAAARQSNEDMLARQGYQGGWEIDEDIQLAASKETSEEAGVIGLLQKN